MTLVPTIEAYVGEPGTADRTYTISELATEFGITSRTIRFYEDEGLISPGRSGANRIYNHRDRGRLVLICRGKRLGFSLTEVKEFLELYDTDHDQVEQMSYARARARARIAQLEEQLIDVRQTLTELREIEAAMAEHLSSHGAGGRA